jgi:hypothetical protein
VEPVPPPLRPSSQKVLIFFPLCEILSLT